METSTPKRGVGSRYAWMIVFVTYLASLVAPLAQFKVPPVASWLIPQFNMFTIGADGAHAPDLVLFGLLMSIMGLLGMVLAFPALFIVRKLGLKATTLISVGCVIVGCVLGIATDNLAVLFTGRVFEGIGLGLVGVSAPAAISIWFPAARRGGPLGIWATWMPIGMVISFTACPAIATALSWQTVWWLNIAIAVVAFILFAFFFKLPEGASEEEVVITAPVKECFATLKNPSIWFLGISFMLFCFYMLGVVNTYFNTFLAEPVEQGGWGMDAISAGLVTSVMTWLPLVAQPVFGFIYDYVGRRKMWLCISFILLLIGSATAWTSGNWGFLWIFLIVANLGGAFAGSAARPLAPDLMPPTALGATMGMVILQVFMNLGAAIGSPIFAGVLEATGHSWQVTGLAVLLPVLALGLVFAALVKWNPPHRFGTRGARKAAGSEQGISPEV